MEKSVREHVIDAFVSVCGFEPSSIIPAKSLRDDFQFDDLDFEDLAEELEDAMDIDIDDNELAGCKTVGDVIAYCENLDKQPEDA